MAEVARRVKDDFRPEVFLVSDFQRSAFPDLEQILFADSTLNWSLLPIQPKPSSNVFVDSAAFENPFLIRGERGKLQVWVRNDGRTAVDHLVLRLTTGNGSGPEILSATATIPLAPQATEVVSFDVVAGDRPISMKISLQDFPVTFDNEFYLTYMPLRRLRVVHLVEGDKQPYLQQVFGSRELFDYTSYSVKAIGYDAMEQADLIILDGLFAADQALVQFARTHPETVWMLVPPVPSGKPEQLRAMSDLSGLEVKPTAGSGKPVPEALAPPAAGDPFFRNVFEESAGSSTPLRMPSAFPAVSWGADRSAILRFRDGTPFLSKIGNRYLFACPLNAAYTDLGSHALFVPLMYRMAATARQVEHALYYGSQARQVWLPGDSVGAELPVRLAGPRETVAPQRLVNGRVRLDLPEQAMMPGIYTALRGQDTLALLAFNADPRESLQDRYALDELRAISAKQPKVRIFEPGDLQAFRDEIKARYLGTPLWKYAIWAALFFLLTEILLLRTPSELRKQAGTSA